MSPIRSSLLLIAVVTGACEGDEDFGPVRNPGGGGPGGTVGGDARLVDAPVDDGPAIEDGRPDDALGVGDAGFEETDGGAGSLTGEVCIVTDLRVPHACPAVPARVGVSVAVRGTALQTVSAADGTFGFAISGAAVLDLADGSPTLVRATVPVVTGAPVQAPVIGQQSWQDVQDAIGQVQPDDRGAIVLYVEDAAGPVTGAIFEQVAGSLVVPYYDDGAALSWRPAGGTGAQGVVLFLDLTPGTVMLSGRAGPRDIVLGSVPVVTDAVTFVRVRLASP